MKRTEGQRCKLTNNWALPTFWFFYYTFDKQPGLQAIQSCVLMRGQPNISISISKGRKIDNFLPLLLVADELIELFDHWTDAISTNQMCLATQLNFIWFQFAKFI